MEPFLHMDKQAQAKHLLWQEEIPGMIVVLFQELLVYFFNLLNNNKTLSKIRKTIKIVKRISKINSHNNC